MKRLILVRHGQTDWNVVSRYQGSSDVPLNDHGRAQARGAAPTLAHTWPVDEIVTSDLSRAHETAQIIAAAMGADVVADARLRERHYGQWEGMLDEDIYAQYADERARWSTGVEPYIDGFESHVSVVERAMAAVTEHVTGTGTHMFVAHGSTIRELMSSLLGLKPGARMIATLGNAHWAVLEHTTHGAPEGRWVLRHHNLAGDTDLR